MTETLKKPKKVTPKPYWNYNDVAGYLEQLHGKTFRDYAGKYSGSNSNPNAPYQDFWHYVIDNNEVHNGGFMYMPDYELAKLNDEPWQVEILGYFKDFLGDDYDEPIWVEW